MPSYHAAGGKLSGKKIKNASIPAGKLKAGAAATNLKISVSSAAATPIATNTVGGTTATCPSGKKAVAGGGLSDGTTDGALIEDTRPVNANSNPPAANGAFTGWRVIWKNTAATPVTPTVYVVCIG